eukprot:4278105-Pleurochrysis_carterae.AAC.1
MCATASTSPSTPIISSTPPTIPPIRRPPLDSEFTCCVAGSASSASCSASADRSEAGVSPVFWRFEGGGVERGGLIVGRLRLRGGWFFVLDLAFSAR